MKKTTKFQDNKLVIEMVFDEKEMTVINFANNNRDVRFDLQDNKEESKYPIELSYQECKEICEQLRDADVMGWYSPDEGDFFGSVYYMKVK